MSSADKLLEQMRRNPKGDWTFADIERILKSRGCMMRSRGGSHFVFTHPATGFWVVVVYGRPIKPVYVRRVIQMVDEIDGAE